MYYVNAIVVGIAIPLLAYAIASTWKSYVSYRARNLSASLRSFADDQLAAIVIADDANSVAKGFAAHLREVLNDSDEMRDRGESFVACQDGAEDENNESDAREFKERVGDLYVDRFERIFPVMTTACLLLHPQLGRMYYRTMVRTAKASFAAKALMQQLDRPDVSFNRKAMEQPNAHHSVPPPVLLFQSSRRREEKQWECMA